MYGRPSQHPMEHIRSMRSRLGPVAAIAAFLLAATTPASAEPVAPGVEHTVIHRDGVTAHVARILPGAPVELRAVVAGEAVGGRLERTSAMCRRVGCLVAINGDFRLPGTNQPVGGVVRDGVLLKSPSATHHQLLVGRDGRLAAGPVDFAGTLVAADLRDIDISSVNHERQEDDVVLYTPAFGPTTGTNPFGAELVLRAVDPPGPLLLGHTTVVEIGTLADGGGGTAIPAGGAVLSGHGEGAERLRALAGRIEAGDVGRRALLRLEATPDAHQSVGGTPILLRDGKRWFADEAADFVRGHHPRTAVAWNDRGEVFLVTVDGRQPGHSEGVSLAELADLLLELGATDALNLDGGGTTTFVVGGEVVNRPSDRLVKRGGRDRIVHAAAAGDVVVGPVERPSTTALAVVPLRGGASGPTELVPDALDLPEPVELPPPTLSDPASRPDDALPALVGTASRRPPQPRVVAGAVAALAVASLALGAARSVRARTE